MPYHNNQVKIQLSRLSPIQYTRMGIFKCQIYLSKLIKLRKCCLIYCINVKIKGKVPQAPPTFTALIFWCICPCYGYAKIPYANSPYALIPYAHIPYADFPLCPDSNMPRILLPRNHRALKNT